MEIADVPAIAAAVIAAIHVIASAVGAFVAYRATGKISLDKTLKAAASSWPVVLAAYRAVTTKADDTSGTAAAAGVRAGLDDIVRQRGRKLSAVEARKAESEIRAMLHDHAERHP